MSRATRILDEKERRQLILLALLFIIALCFLFLATVGQKRSSRRLAIEVEGKEKARLAIEAKRAAASAEWSRWEQALKDLAEIEGQYFYRENDGLHALRLDLEKLLFEAGIRTQAIRYDYVDRVREREKKVVVTFNFSGSYSVVKRFLEAVERWPKFLIIENVDFVKIAEGGNLLELRTTLAGYYESF